MIHRKVIQMNNPYFMGISDCQFAQEWAQRWGASPAQTTHYREVMPLTDGQFGVPTEFDEYLDYLDEQSHRETITYTGWRLPHDNWPRFSCMLDVRRCDEVTPSGDLMAAGTILFHGGQATSVIEWLLDRGYSQQAIDSLLAGREARDD
jgi:hypothetical protein